MNRVKYSLGKIVIICLLVQNILCASDGPGPLKNSDSISKFVEEVSGINKDGQRFNRTPDVIMDNGYIVETHNFSTVSGFTSVMFRIPCPHNTSCLKTGNHTSGMPVILYHGLWQSSFHWVQNKRDASLAFMLADAGFDVWLPNARGTEYCTKHLFLTPTDRKFWDFSLDDIADEEIPPMIDHILATTKYEQLYYIGYAFGNMIAFGGLSLHHPYNAKVKMLVAMSPMVYVGNTKAPIMRPSHSVAVTRLYELVQRTYGFTPIPDPKFATYIKNFVASNCKTPDQLTDPTAVCNSEAFAYDQRPLAVSNSSTGGVKVDPSPASSKNMIHISQMINSKTFQMYNYRNLNTAVYGLLDPPLYKLWKLDVPVALIWATKDVVNDPLDVAKLTRHIPNIVDNYKVPFEEFTHSDFIRGDNAPELVYTYIINLMKKGPGEPQTK